MHRPWVDFIFGSCLALTGCASREQPGGASREGLVDSKFRFAREFTGRYCVDCHASWGGHGLRDKAVLNLKMDPYRDWTDADGAVPGVLDKDSLEAPVMPPPSFPRQPTDAERRIMVEWVKRGSPDTDSGK
jgi:hypothetical protein